MNDQCSINTETCEAARVNSRAASPVLVEHCPSATVAPGFGAISFSVPAVPSAPTIAKPNAGVRVQNIVLNLATAFVKLMKRFTGWSCSNSKAISTPAISSLSNKRPTISFPFSFPFSNNPAA